MSKSNIDSGEERRLHPRHPVKIDVNYRRGETYLYSRTENLSELGIFLVSKEPLERKTKLELRFSAPEGGHPIEVTGEVVWVDKGGGGRSPGMGIRFVDPSPEVRERIKSLIRTIAYLE
jgi:type IV pilus assembly protein PilZ